MRCGESSPDLQRVANTAKFELSMVIVPVVMADGGTMLGASLMYNTGLCMIMGQQGGSRGSTWSC